MGASLTTAFVRLWFNPRSHNNLYGTTFEGGAYDQAAGGGGTLFKLSPQKVWSVPRFRLRRAGGAAGEEETSITQSVEGPKIPFLVFFSTRASLRWRAQSFCSRRLNRRGAAGTRMV